MVLVDGQRMVVDTPRAEDVEDDADQERQADDQPGHGDVLEEVASAAAGDLVVGGVGGRARPQQVQGGQPGADHGHDVDQDAPAAQGEPALDPGPAAEAVDQGHGHDQEIGHVHGG